MTPFSLVNRWACQCVRGTRFLLPPSSEYLIYLIRESTIPRALFTTPSSDFIIAWNLCLPRRRLMQINMHKGSWIKNKLNCEVSVLLNSQYRSLSQDITKWFLLIVENERNLIERTCRNHIHSYQQVPGSSAEFSRAHSLRRRRWMESSANESPQTMICVFCVPKIEYETYRKRSRSASYSAVTFGQCWVLKWVYWSHVTCLCGNRWGIVLYY